MSTKKRGKSKRQVYDLTERAAKNARPGMRHIPPPILSLIIDNLFKIN